MKTPEPLFYDTDAEKKRIAEFVHGLQTQPERAEIAYAAFRGGFRGGTEPPHWNELKPWMRDAMKVAYLQGRLDGKEQLKEKPTMDALDHNEALENCLRIRHEKENERLREVLKDLKRSHLSGYTITEAQWKMVDRVLED